MKRSSAPALLVDVGVVLAGELAIRAADLLGARVARDAEHSRSSRGMRRPSGLGARGRRETTPGRGAARDRRSRSPSVRRRRRVRSGTSSLSRTATASWSLGVEGSPDRADALARRGGRGSPPSARARSAGPSDRALGRHAAARARRCRPPRASRAGAPRGSPATRRSISRTVRLR